MSTTKNMTPADLREAAFRDLEQSIATIKQGAEHLPNENPIVLRMIGAIGVAESSLKIISVIPSSEVRALTGPLHGEDDVEFDAGGAIPVEVVSGDAREPQQDVVSGATGTEAPQDGPPAYAIAHAQKKLQCGAKDLGCTHKKTNGNSNGRHQQVCPFFQTAKLLEAGYRIETIEDYAKALKKENGGKLPYDSIESMRKTIERKCGSYRKVLLSVRAGMKARDKAKAGRRRVG